MSNQPTYYHKLTQFYTLFNAWNIVKKKGSFGGVDKISIETFGENEKQNIEKLAHLIKTETYSPEPYYKICIPKNDTEKRELGLLTVQDKIVQTAIKLLIEPIFEKYFANVSYGYRPEKGAAKAVRRVQNTIKEHKSKFILSVDIHNFFDTVQHELMFKKLAHLIKDEKLIQLIKLCICIGKVNEQMHWTDIKQGVPQGAVLSPLLANLYLHDLDIWAINQKIGYIRYADDFILMLQTEKQAQHYAHQIKSMLSHSFHLETNDKTTVKPLTDGFEYLGILIKEKSIELSNSKIERLKFKITEAIKIGHLNNLFKINDVMQGIQAFYGKLLNPEQIRFADELLLQHIGNLIQQTKFKYEPKEISSRLLKLHFITEDYIINKKQKFAEQLTILKIIEPLKKTETEKIIEKKKRTYQKLEAEGMELLITSPGAYIGKTEGTLRVRFEHKYIQGKELANLKHITIISRGVSISSDAIQFCILKEIGIDFFDEKGIHLSSIFTNQNTNARLWQHQLESMQTEKAKIIANKLVDSKITNQLNLIKYFNKYHKTKIAGLATHVEKMEYEFKKLEIELENVDISIDIKLYRQQLLSIEGRAAAFYWDAVKLLIAEQVTFERREHRGAKDTMNCLLNYGYAILYARIWISLLNNGLNPYISYLHTAQTGKPTLVFDFIEQFRSQVVDRVIIAMIQKDEPIKIKNGYLDLETRIALSENIFERWNRIELFRGEHIRFHDIVYKCASKFADYIEGIEKNYKPYIGKW